MPSAERLSTTELQLLGLMVHHSTGAGPFPQHLADTFARALGVGAERQGLVQAIYARRIDPDAPPAHPVSTGLLTLREALLTLREALLGLLDGMPFEAAADHP